MNQIYKVELTLLGTGRWLVGVHKQFAPEHGGGTQGFFEDGTPSIHRALEIAKGMVTLSPGQRTDPDKTAQVQDQVFLDPMTKLEQAWRVMFNYQIQSPTFNSKGAAQAFLDALKEGRRKPEVA